MNEWLVWSIALVVVFSAPFVVNWLQSLWAKKDENSNHEAK